MPRPSIALLIGAAVFGGFAAYVWLRRGSAGAKAFILILVSGIEYTITYALELNSTNVASQQLWGDLKYLGICVLPIAWLAFTLIRGAFTGYYPYPFLDAGEQGYGWVTLNSVVIGLFFVALATGALFADRAFARRATRVVPEIGPEPQPETT